MNFATSTGLPITDTAQRLGILMKAVDSRAKLGLSAPEQADLLILLSATLQAAHSFIVGTPRALTARESSLVNNIETSNLLLEKVLLKKRPGP